MPRKRKHKNVRKASKRQGSTPSKPWVSPPSQQTRPAIKISEAILTLAEPLRTQYREPHRMQAMISLAVMAWNISLFPDEEHAHVQGMLLESLPTQLSGEDVGVLLSTMNTLIARKRLLYPQRIGISKALCKPRLHTQSVTRPAVGACANGWYGTG